MFSYVGGYLYVPVHKDKNFENHCLDFSQRFEEPDYQSMSYF